MDSDEGKLFVGGIAWDTTEDTLKDYFTKFGDVSHAVVMRDKTTGRPRGFGFVLFSDPSSLDAVLQENHTIDGRQVEAKRALSREDQNSFRQDQSNAGRGSGTAANLRTKKIFVGGLPPTITEEGFRQYFESYGHVTDAVIMYDQTTQRPRGFGFISFDTEDAVDRVLHKTFHDLNGKDVEVKRALPREANPGGSSNNRGGGGGGGYQNYGSSRSNTSGSYDNRMDRNRFMQPPQSGGGGGVGGAFSSYPGYSTAAYGGGYGGATAGYGGYSGYGVGGYGGAAGGFVGPTGGYGGSNAAASAMKTAWNNQTPGYGSSGYGGSAGYGSAQTGQSPGGGQGYYGNYGGSGYGSGGYGAVGGRTTGSGPGNSDVGDLAASGGGGGGGYMGSGGYGENNRSSGYGNSGWRSDPSQAAAGGGGYGDPQSWQGGQQ